MQSLEYRCTTD